MLIELTIEGLLMKIEQLGISKRQIALATGLHQNSLTKMGKEGWNPSYDTLRKIEAFVSTAS